MLQVLQELQSPITVAEARTFCRLFDNEFDGVLQTLIDAGIEYIESETRLEWRPRQYRWTDKSDRLPDAFEFPRTPVKSIDALRNAAGNAVAYTADNYDLESDPAKLIGVGSLGAKVVEWTTGGRPNSTFRLLVLQFVVDNFDSPGGSPRLSASVLRLLESIKSARDAIR